MRRALLCLPLVLLVGCAYDYDQRDKALQNVRALTDQLANIETQLTDTSLSPSLRNDLETQRATTAERLATESSKLEQANKVIGDKARNIFGTLSNILGIFLAGGGVAAGVSRGVGGLAVTP